MPIERSDVIEDLKRIFDDATDGRVSELALSEDMAIIDDIGLQSVDFLEIAFRIEKKWNITIDNDEYKTLRTVGDVIDLIERKGGSAQSATATV